MSRLLVFLLFGVIPPPAGPQVIPLYPGAAPGSESWDWTEQSSMDPQTGILRISNVTRPTVSVFLPERSRATGTGVVIVPGGAFRILAFNHEGTEVAEWLNSMGVAAFLLKYRVMRTDDLAGVPKEVQQARAKEAMSFGVADALEAMRMVKRRAAEWGVDPARIGILGFSAGGYITAQVALTEDESARPAFAVPVYAYFPEERPVPAAAPPLFLVHAADDRTVAPEHSVRLFQSWRKASRPVEMHIFEAGGHGFGMRAKGLPVDGWTARLREWLAAQGMLTTARR
ncbi:MAG: alpha/beta hydrolase [Bryobacteraceae bacterium]|nr:alpha/beta hydrolase [Bryobacteraceae bacterium]MCX7603141.1 alpha/beta hydrolase [Bryobacteraceae bacterium]